MYDLYRGAEVIVDYKAQYNQDIIDHFEENSNFEGYTSLNSIDYEAGLFTIEGFPKDPISTGYLIVLNQNTNEYENFKDGSEC